MFVMNQIGTHPIQKRNHTLMDSVNGQIPYLSEIIEKIEDLPIPSLLLGICQDGLPLMADLSSTGSGSLLIASEHDFVNANFLFSILTSGYLMNQDKYINLHLLSPKIDYYDHLLQQPMFKIGFYPDQAESEIVIQEFGNLVENRINSGDYFPIQVLAVEDLDRLYAMLSEKGKAQFNWLIQYGSQFGVLIIGSIQSRNIHSDYFKLIDCFQLRIVGQIKESSITRFLLKEKGEKVELSNANEAVVFSDIGSLPIYLPRSINFPWEGYEGISNGY